MAQKSNSHYAPWGSGLPFPRNYAYVHSEAKSIRVGSWNYHVVVKQVNLSYKLGVPIYLSSLICLLQVSEKCGTYKHPVF